MTTRPSTDPPAGLSAKPVCPPPSCTCRRTGGVNRHIRPFYLRGSTGTVTGWSGRSAIVSLDVPSARYAEVRCPAIGLDRMAAECGD
jgi:hypothetical protein